MTDYGKSKFQNAVAEYLYGLSLDGCGEETGDTSCGGLYTRIEFDEEQAAHVNSLLPEDEQHGRSCWFSYAEGGEITHVTTGYHGAILHEDSIGFVNVHSLAETSMEMDDEWNEIEHLHDHEVEVA